jgi:hypothetical protein
MAETRPLTFTTALAYLSRGVKENLFFIRGSEILAFFRGKIVRPRDKNYFADRRFVLSLAGLRRDDPGERP